MPADVPVTLSHYRLLEPIGQGGMGVVYKAEDTRLGRFVAIKLLPESIASDGEAIERFQREARAASRLSHPNICAVHDVGNEGGRHFIVLEYLEGTPLDRLTTAGPLPAGRVVEIGIEIADALEAAHGARMLHRDIKPANVFITARGQAKLLDFGLAKVAGSGPGADAASTEGDLTSPGQVVGTVAFMSPEQVRGEPLDARSDLFSLGALLYQAATGRPAFPGSTAGTVQDAILNRAPVPAGRVSPELPPRLEEVIHKSLEKDPRLRYQQAADLRAELLRVQRDLQSASGGTAFHPAATPAGRTPNWAWPAAAFLVLSLVALGAWMLLPSATSDAIDSVAVLPFVNEGGAADTEYLTDGLTEGLMNSLSQLPGVRVSGRGAVFRYRGATDPQAAGRELGVRAVLSGRLRARGDTLIVRTDLMDVNTGAHLWGDEFPGASSDLLALQQELTAEISERLRPRLTEAERERLAAPPTGNAAAHEAYLRGRHQWQKRSPEGTLRAREHFQQAIDLDPDYARAHAGLADAYNQLAFFHVMRPRDAIPAAKAAAARALARDEHLADGHVALAWASFTYDWDYAAATTHITRALELDPTVREHTVYAFYLTVGRRHAEAIAAAHDVVATDRLSASLSHTLAVQLALAGDLEAALEESRRTVRLDPTFGVAYEVMAGLLVSLGRTAEALPEAQRAVDRSPGNLISLAMLGYVQGRAGLRQEAAQVLARLDSAAASGRYVPAHAYALVHVGLGQTDEAFAALDRSFDERYNRLAYLGLEPVWDGIREDPRFDQLLTRIGLPQR